MKNPFAALDTFDVPVTKKKKKKQKIEKNKNKNVKNSPIAPISNQRYFNPTLEENMGWETVNTKKTRRQKQKIQSKETMIVIVEEEKITKTQNENIEPENKNNEKTPWTAIITPTTEKDTKQTNQENWTTIITPHYKNENGDGNRAHSQKLQKPMPKHHDQQVTGSANFAYLRRSEPPSRQSTSRQSNSSSFVNVANHEFDNTFIPLPNATTCNAATQTEMSFLLDTRALDKNENVDQVQDATNIDSETNIEKEEPSPTKRKRKRKRKKKRKKKDNAESIEKSVPTVAKNSSNGIFVSTNEVDEILNEMIANEKENSILSQCTIC